MNAKRHGPLEAAVESDHHIQKVGLKFKSVYGKALVPPHTALTKQPLYPSEMDITLSLHLHAAGKWIILTRL